MLNFDLNKKNVIIDLPIRNDYYSMVSKKRLDKRTECVIMSYITEKEEELIDNGKTIVIKRGNTKFTINPANIYCYGIIDFHPDSEDIDIISTFNWLDHLIIRGICIPANYNYDKHQCLSINKKPMWFDTLRCDYLARYAHGFLGKPERTIIFRQIC